jgi:serine/threonine protein kinase
MSTAVPQRQVGRYTMFGELGVGGMATVHYARLNGPVGFGRTVAMKRLHPQFARDPEFVRMFVDEARLASRIRHPNVVQTLDVVEEKTELFLVMDYVHGESLSHLLRRCDGRGLPPRLVSAILAGVLHGLHAAHEAKNEQGEPLGIVHRDVSPQNVLVGADGVPRLLDFGIARAVVRLHTTGQGLVKGKLGYMAPEQHEQMPITRLADIYAASVVGWELLTGRRLFAAESETATVSLILKGKVTPPSHLVSSVPRDLEAIILKGLSVQPHKRFASARAMALEIERMASAAPASELSEWVEEVASETLRSRARSVAALECLDIVKQPSDSTPRALDEDVIEIPADRAEGDEPSTDVPVSSVRTPPQWSIAQRLALAALMVGLLVAGTVIGASWQRVKAGAGAASADPTATVPPTTTTTTTATQTPTAAATPTSTQTPTTTPGSNETPPSPLAPSRTEPASASGRAARADAPKPPTMVSQQPTAATPAPQTPSCDPPYYTDAVGHRHYRPECFPP